MAKKGGEKVGGRVKGTPNKTTALLKDAILTAAEEAGNEFEGADGKPMNEGLIGYLKVQAVLNPGPFMGLMGKVLPLQINANVTQHNAEVTDEIMTPEEWAEQWAQQHETTH
tara:strand:- start:424 stop:759 length:336 start_codon:yes stop_codon:yes gene_type:complete